MEVVDRLVNSALLNQFLRRAEHPRDDRHEKIDEQIEQVKQNLKTEGQGLATMLTRTISPWMEIRKV